MWLLCEIPLLLHQVRLIHCDCIGPTIRSSINPNRIHRVAILFLFPRIVRALLLMLLSVCVALLRVLDHHHLLERGFRLSFWLVDHACGEDLWLRTRVRHRFASGLLASAIHYWLHVGVLVKGYLRFGLVSFQQLRGSHLLDSISLLQ